MATDEELAAAVATAVATAAKLKGRPAVTPDGVVVGTYSGGWDVKLRDASIVYLIDPAQVSEADVPSVVETPRG